MRESISTFLDLFTRSEFQLGVLFGAIGLALISVTPRSPSWLRPWAATVAAAALVGVMVIEGQRLGLVFGIAAMSLGGWFTGSARTVRGVPIVVVAGWCLAAFGAALIPWRGQIEPDSWFFVATPLVALGLAALMATWTNGPSREWLGPITTITAFAIWTTIPETDLARMTLGVTLPLAFGTLPPVSASVTRAGSFALAGVLAWMPALGGEARPASIVGAWACVGVIALLPVANRLWPQRSLRTVALLGLHSFIVLIAARVIGLWTWAVPAVVAACALFAFGLLLAYLLGRRTPETGIKVRA